MTLCAPHTKHKLEVKSASALKKNTKLPIEERMLSYHKDGLSSIQSCLVQHVKSELSDYIIAPIYMLDGTILYMKDCKNINPSTLSEDIDTNRFDINMKNQQKGHATEGAFTVKECQLVGIIDGYSIENVDLTYTQLFDAYKSNTVLNLGSQVAINHFDQFVGF